MRVLEVLGRSTGGIARHVALVASSLDGRDGIEVDVAGPPDGPVTMPVEVIPVAIPDGPVSGHRKSVRRLEEIIAAGGYQVVHGHGLRAGINSGLAARRVGVPVVLTVHNLVRPEIVGGLRARLYRFSEPFAVRLSTRTFAASAEMAARLRAAAPGSAYKVDVLYLGVGDAPAVETPAEKVRADLGLGDGDRLIVTVTRLARQKAVHVMVAALARLSPVDRLAVVGEGPLGGDLRALAEELGVGERVLWLGWRDRVADIVAAADVFCLSSIWEACSLAAQEAILLGTPVVSTAVGGMGELIDDRLGGRLVPSGDADALAAALSEVLEDRRAAAAYAAHARAQLLVRFSTERMLTKLTEAYRGLASAT